MTEAQARQLKIPCAVVLSPEADWIHLRSVTQRLADTLPNAVTLEWPWAKDGALEREATKIGFSALFPRWREIAPALANWAQGAVFKQ
jgi:hypothetical protein